ncbi:MULTISPECIES: TIGR04255 family protein [Cyanophyceae]|uniref:TIGR04255 family protein n=1 Tax=Cyanophyceae TaxID=3028117 RepID=UPI0002A663F4|nr:MULTISPECIES: TIGR04255 family protein [Cyanophyceae]AFZ33478.1 hypothetical protein Glo7428_5091 [Gloeocapsa sp. PCC 7428]PPS41987.1 TIGR04255 family protein [Chroococcidiopsis sp. TS-821]
MSKLSKPPLFMVLCQVNFVTVLKMANFIQDIQESLRKKGFPIYEEEIIQEFIIAKSQIHPEVAEKKRWVFSDIKRKQCVILSTDSVVLETICYEELETFIKTFEGVLETIQVTASPEFAVRIGLRYIDIIKSDQSASLNELIQEGLRGFAFDRVSGLSKPESTSLTKTETPIGGILVVRTMFNSDNVVLPQDLATSKLKFDLPETNDNSITLDIDHFAELNIDFKSDEVLQTIRKLHTYTSEAFKVAVTPKALEQWK